ncbi:MAG TPA: DUF167 domain-containing protein [Acidimicrobiales bacterium]|nr:DUF167 domain-containing protein [Acidimicrobiales bacterium]
MTVRVHPRSARERRAWDGTRLELWIRQPPVDGAANAATVDEVARWLGIPRRLVRIVAGHTSRTKIVEVGGVDALPRPDGTP